MTQETTFPEVIIEEITPANNLKTFALIDENNQVVSVVQSASINDCIETLGFDETFWKESSHPTINLENEDNFIEEITAEIKPNYPGIGSTWDSERENFILPKPEDHPSWILNEYDNWVPPIPRPEDFHYPPENNIIDYDGKGFSPDGAVSFEHYWDEESVSWRRVYKKFSREYRIYYFWDEENQEWIIKENHSSGIPISDVSSSVVIKPFPEKYFIGIGTDLI